MSFNRVFITGLSALTAVGNTAESTWQAILAGKNGIDEIKQWDLSSWEYRLGGELKAFQPEKVLPDRKLLKAVSRQDVLGIHAAVQAIHHSKILEYRETLTDQEEKSFNDKTAVYVGSPGNKYFQQDDFLPLLAKTSNLQEFAKELFHEIHPMWLLRILPNNVLAYIGILYSFKGPNHDITNHAVGGLQALLEAFHALQQGEAERAVVIAYDLGVEPQALFYYTQLGLISKCHLKPFDRAHNGTILAEGAAALILESEASVQRRSALCYGEIAGGLSTSEASGLFSLASDGKNLMELIRQVLKEQNLAASEIDCVIAHGNANAKSDESEAKAILEVLGGVPVTAFKWSKGHTLSAAGVLDVVLCSYVLQEQCLPGIANFSILAPYCENLNVRKESLLLKNPKNALLINRGFASMNACLVVKSCV